MNELHALVKLKNDLGEISDDISNEIQSERSSVVVDDKVFICTKKKKTTQRNW